MANQNEFPTVEELSVGFSEFKLEPAVELIGQSITLDYEDGFSAVYAFLDHECLKVCYAGAIPDIEEAVQAEQPDVYTCLYSAVSPRKGIYLVDLIEYHERPRSVTTVIDCNRGIATSLWAQLPTSEEADVSMLVRGKNDMPMTSVTGEYHHAAVGAPFTAETEKHEFTEELVGKRVRFQYSSNDTYEHIYLNDKYYTWHCLSGIEKGLCDTDRCYYLKLADDLYWFTWLEKVVPTIGTVVEDLAPGVMRSYGKLCGYDSYDHGKIVNFQVGSYASEQ